MPVLVIRGPSAVGKTTVAERLAARLSPVAVVPLDWLRHMVGAWDPTSEDEAVLASRNAAALARNFAAAGYNVIVEGLLDRPAAVSTLVGDLRGVAVQVITLSAGREEILRRHHARPLNHRATLDRVTSAYQRIGGSRQEVGGMWIETDGMSPDRVVDLILMKVGQGDHGDKTAP